MKTDNKCPKCGGEVEKGIVAPSIGFHKTVASGGQWWGSKITTGLNGNDVQDAKDVDTYRCKSCGYLESYAN